MVGWPSRGWEGGSSYVSPRKLVWRRPGAGLFVQFERGSILVGWAKSAINWANNCTFLLLDDHFRAFIIILSHCAKVQHVHAIADGSSKDFT